MSSRGTKARTPAIHLQEDYSLNCQGRTLWMPGPRPGRQGGSPSAKPLETERGGASTCSGRGFLSGFSRSRDQGELGMRLSAGSVM